MWIIGPILGALVLALLLLSVPLHLVFSSGRSPERTQTDVTVKWLFGLIRFRISPREREPGKQRQGGKRSRFLFIMLRTYGFAQRLLAFARDLLRVVHVRWLHVDVRLGLPDPADTGMLAGAVMPVMALASPFHGIELNIEPDFCFEGLQARIHGELKVYPIALIMPVVRLVFSVPTFRVLKAVATRER